MVNEISKVHAREILDSRGNPTIEVEVWVNTKMGRAIAPSGASTGIREAVELRDGDADRYNGKGVLKAVHNVNKKISKAITGFECTRQAEIDNILIEVDGTSNKANLGANATVATSMAVAKCAAKCNEMSLYKSLNPDASLLPIPMFNVLNGGKHAGTKLAPQEFMIMPIDAENFREALRMGAETYHMLASIVSERYGLSAKNVGDEGGYAPNMNNTFEALECLMMAIEKAGYVKEVSIALDPAASSFYDGEKEKYLIDGKSLTAQQLVDLWVELSETFPIVSIEDPFQEEDFDSFAELTGKIGSRVQVVGDDIFVTNVNLIKRGIEKLAANSVLLKLNQIGTVSETINALNLAHNSGWTTVVSHRSGESEDHFIADFAVAIEAGQIKTGAPARGERTAKDNQLLRIEEELGVKARYSGRKFRLYNH